MPRRMKVADRQVLAKLLTLYSLAEILAEVKRITVATPPSARGRPRKQPREDKESNTRELWIAVERKLGENSHLTKADAAKFVERYLEKHFPPELHLSASYIEKRHRKI